MEPVLQPFRQTARSAACFLVAGLIPLALAATGCGRGNGTVAVTGVATLKDGPPLPRGRVFLTGGSASASGQINPDGTFTLGTFTTSDGARPGVYTAHIVGATEEDTRSEFDRMSGNGKPPPSLIDRKYDAAATSDLKVEIKPPKTHLELLLDPKASAAKRPARN